MADVEAPSAEQASELYKLLAVCAILIITSGAVSYAMYKEKNPKSNFNEWFNGKKFSYKSILVCVEVWRDRAHSLVYHLVFIDLVHLI